MNVGVVTFFISLFWHVAFAYVYPTNWKGDVQKAQLLCQGKESVSNQGVLTTFLVDNGKIWYQKVEEQNKFGSKTLQSFTYFESAHFEIYNHKKNKLLMGTQAVHHQWTLYSTQKEKVGSIVFQVNEVGKVLRQQTMYDNPMVMQEIESELVTYYYNCTNEPIYLSRQYSYFDQPRRFRRKSDAKYYITYCDYDARQNAQLIFYKDASGRILYTEKRIFTYMK